MAVTWPAPSRSSTAPTRRAWAGMSYPSAGAADLPWPARSTRMIRQAPASCGITGSHQAAEAAVPWIISTDGPARPAVLHDMHVTIVKPHEPAASVQIAGHVLCHCAVS